MEPTAVWQALTVKRSAAKTGIPLGMLITAVPSEDVRLPAVNRAPVTCSGCRASANKFSKVRVQVVNAVHPCRLCQSTPCESV